MAGVDDSADKKPLLWTPKDILKGSVTKDGKTYLFNDVLDEYSIIKIEIVAYVEGVGFVPMSNAFEFVKSNGEGINHEKITVDTVDSLRKDVKKFHEKGNLMKVLKRLYVIALTKKEKGLSNKLINIFNSDIGKIYNCKSDLEAIAEVIEKYHDKTNMQRAYNEIQKIKESVGMQSVYTFKKDFYKKFDKASLTKNPGILVKNLDQLKESILLVVNKLLKKQIKSDRINYKKYL